MFIICKIVIKLNNLCLGNTSKIVQPRLSYSSRNSSSMSSSVVPIISYFNADTKKDAAIKQNKGKSGIYRWTNKVNNKTYIGSSINLTGKKKKELFLPVKFNLEILEYCDRSNLIRREQYYMDLLKPEYNVLISAGSILGFKHSEARKELFRSIRLGLNSRKRLD